MDDKILARYLIETPGEPEQIAQTLARNQSTGTFTAVPGETEDLRARCEIKVRDVRIVGETNAPANPLLPFRGKEKGWFRQAEVTLEIPLGLIGTDLSTLLTVVAGAGFDAKMVSGLRLRELILPEVFALDNPGPQFGIAGTRRVAGVEGRPIIGSIIKPSVGLLPEQTGSIVFQLARAGVDFIKDDEKLTSPPYSRLDERVRHVAAAVSKAAEETGREVMYAFNISDCDPEVMAKRHDAVVKGGGKCVLVNINQVGLGALIFLRKRTAVPIHAHRNGWGMLTRCPSLGWDFAPYNLIWRLAGIDHMHVNGLRNKYWEPDDSVLLAIKDCITPVFSDRDRVFPVIGSGQWADQVEDTFRLAQSPDLIFLAGGGIQGHPGGPGAGVASIHQAWEAALAGIPATEYAKTHLELAEAFEKFGGIRF